MTEKELGRVRELNKKIRDLEQHLQALHKSAENPAFALRCLYAVP